MGEGPAIFQEHVLLPHTRSGAVWTFSRPDLGWLAAGRPVVDLKRCDQDALLEDCDLPSAERRDEQDRDERDRLARVLAGAHRATRSDHDDRRPNWLVELACCLLLEQPSLARSEVCRELGVSEGYLSRRFSAELGISFLEERARLRLVRFLTREGQNFLEASLSAAFGSYSQLHRVFTQLIGMSPRAYLQRGGRNGRGLITGPQATADDSLFEWQR